MNYPSRLIEDAVLALAKLPGIGKKTALRLVIHLLQKETEETQTLADSLSNMRQNIKFCSQCHNISDDDICGVCSNPMRDESIIGVVENFRDILSIENTHYYKGMYHVLGGVIAPIDGIGPEQLNIKSLIERVEKGNVKEVIMALNPTIDGDTTIFYLSKRLSDFGLKITTIARGISFGGELEYVDEITLARSISARLPFEQYLK
jgi:recombination protein RecR